MLRALLSVSLTLILAVVPATAQTTGLYDLGTNPTLRASSTSPDVVEFDAQIGRLEFVDVETDQGTFTRLVDPSTVGTSNWPPSVAVLIEIGTRQ